MKRVARSNEEHSPPIQTSCLGPVDECAHPEADSGDEDEAEIAVGGLVVSGGEAAPVLQPVEATLDPVPERVDVVVDRDLNLPASPHRDDRRDAARFHCRTDGIGIVAAIGEQNLRFRPVGIQERQSTGVVGGLAGCDVDGYGETGSVGAEMNFGRKPTSRAPETLSRSPPLAPAAQ